MLHLDDTIQRNLARLEVRDPREMAADSLISHRLRRGENANTYRLRDAALWNGRPGPLLTCLAGRALGEHLHLALNSDRHGTTVEVHEADMARHALSLMLRGAAAVTQGGTETILSGSRGAVVRGVRGTRLDTSDRSTRVNLWVADALLLRMLQAMLQDEPRAPLHFQADLDWSSATGASLLRLLSHLLAELRDAEGMAANEMALASFGDLVAGTMLRRLPHSYAAALDRPIAAAIPRQLRRAEAYMIAHADRPIVLAEVAAAAGCSLRALQLAFRRFRDTTPHAALQAMRLEAVRAALIAEREAPPGPVARRFGFSNATRFAEAYRRHFGETPTETQRRSGRR